jgi:hypothetical protein
VYVSTDPILARIPTAWVNQHVTTNQTLRLSRHRSVPVSHLLGLTGTLGVRADETSKGLTCLLTHNSSTDRCPCREKPYRIHTTVVNHTYLCTGYITKTLCGRDLDGNATH